MTSTMLLTAAVLFGLFQGPYRPTTTQLYGEGGWILSVQTDRFTHETRCQIENRQGRHPDVVVAPSGLAFRFDTRLDAYDAWFQVDDGQPRPWRDVIARLVATGSLAQAERLDNAMGGMVVIPLSDLIGAKRVTVRPSAKYRPRVFDIQGVSTLMPSAEGLGCRFVGPPR